MAFKHRKYYTITLQEEDTQALMELLQAEENYCERPDVDESEKTKIAQIKRMQHAVGRAKLKYSI